MQLMFDIIYTTLVSGLFIVASPQLWKNMPLEIRSFDDLNTFNNKSFYILIVLMASFFDN